MVAGPALRNRFQAEVDKYNARLGSHEQKKRFEMTGHAWAVDRSELRVSMKMRQGFISQKYKAQEGKMFMPVE